MYDVSHNSRLERSERISHGTWGIHAAYGSQLCGAVEYRNKSRCIIASKRAL